jgi:hypothetical protein
VPSLDDALDPDLLERARTDDRSWHTWCDGLAPARFSAEVDRVALRPGLDSEVITGEAAG